VTDAEVTTVRITWEDRQGNAQSGTVDIPGRPDKLVSIEYFYRAGCFAEPLDLTAPDGVTDFEDNPYLDLFERDGYKIIDPKGGHD
jgi:hypothetical protein